VYVADVVSSGTVGPTVQHRATRCNIREKFLKDFLRTAKWHPVQPDLLLAGGVVFLPDPHARPASDLALLRAF
jgi:hypothetical protein